MVLYLCSMCPCRCFTSGVLAAQKNWTFRAMKGLSTFSRTSKYRRTFIPISVTLWNDLADLIFDGVGLAGFKSRAMLVYWPKLPARLLSSTVFHFSSFFVYVGIVGLGSSD